MEVLRDMTEVLDREGQFTIHKMETSDIIPLSKALCDMDKREILLLGENALDAMRHSFLLGGYVARNGDCPVATFGVNRNSSPAAIWFLGTSDRFSYPKTFQTLSKRWVRFLCDDLICGNIVPSDHAQTIKWLESLDFIVDSTPYNIEGHDFFSFVRYGPESNSLPH